MGIQTAPGAGRPAGRTAVVRCRDGDHTIELTEREPLAERLIKISRRHSFDPDTDVDWERPLDPDRFYMPPPLVSLYETPLWDAMTHRQRVELSKREVAEIASFGIWSELLLMNILLKTAYRHPYDSRHGAYALTELADECRHSMMFARMVRTLGLRTHHPHPLVHHGAKLAAGAPYLPLQMFAGTLVVEEFTDSLQRVSMADEEIQPLVRQVSRIHVIEEARHIRYAREELKRQVAKASPARRRFAAAGIARFTSFIPAMLIHPSVYRAVGLDPGRARRAAAESPHRRAVWAWAMRRCTRFFDEVGFLDGRGRRIWDRAGLLTDEYPKIR
ncbi:P-aminobenzoate N-oxygenase AurF [Thermomonospora echinospora]|uniref:p-aminobenzoate N-oxygenase AurF n=1 Tax=Thermomonospora echinospora TaxID=1992 RepID=A0A1H6D6A5_9ACTN|nr:diiron oxygenase [Thermomonospora echinospora]SEG80870.1 P-aminobenzoate N-oxygenase AurF [Thermomonospora echinospora]